MKGKIMKKNITTLIRHILVYSLALFIIGCVDKDDSKLTQSQEDLKKLIQSQEDIKKELTDIKKLIAERPAAPVRPPEKPFEPTDISIADSPVLGQANAPVTLIEFTDYRCPFCRRHALTTKAEIVKEYVDTGKVKYVLREFPLKALHPDSDQLSQAALCAGDQGKYWEMHDALFAVEGKLDPKDLSKQIKALKLDKKEFKACVDSKKYAKKIETDIADGAKLGVTGTPSFFLGKSDPADSTKIRATKAIKGAQPFPGFKKEIDELLK